MKKAKSICTYIGCSALIDSGSRCSLHPYEDMRKSLDSKKTPEARKFYSSSKWTKTSKQQRKIEPLCRECKKNGLIVDGKIADHNPDRQVLIDRGLDPFDFKYLQTLCFSCHQKKLRVKRNN